MSQSASFYALTGGGKESDATTYSVVSGFGAKEVAMSLQEIRTVSQIQSVISVHAELKQYATLVQVTIENAVIMLRGTLPSVDLKKALVPCVRQAGALGQVCNCVKVG